MITVKSKGAPLILLAVFFFFLCFIHFLKTFVKKLGEIREINQLESTFIYQDLEVFFKNYFSETTQVVFYSVIHSYLLFNL